MKTGLIIAGIILLIIGIFGEQIFRKIRHQWIMQTAIRIYAPADPNADCTEAFQKAFSMAVKQPWWKANVVILERRKYVISKSLILPDEQAFDVEFDRKVEGE